MSATEQEVDTLARTIWGEARGEGFNGQVAVGWVIRNRVFDGKARSWWGEGYAGVCRAPWQFSCWNANDPNSAYLRGERPIPAADYMQCHEAAVAAMTGKTDPTGGATHYYSITMKKAPKWTVGATRTCKIGRHIFFKDVP